MKKYTIDTERDFLFSQTVNKHLLLSLLKLQDTAYDDDEFTCTFEFP